MFDLNRLYNADCMEAMKEIPDKFFSLLYVTRLMVSGMTDSASGYITT